MNHVDGRWIYHTSSGFDSQEEALPGGPGSDRSPIDLTSSLQINSYTFPTELVHCDCACALLHYNPPSGRGMHVCVYF